MVNDNLDSKIIEKLLEEVIRIEKRAIHEKNITNKSKLLKMKRLFEQEVRY